MSDVSMPQTANREPLLTIEILVSYFHESAKTKDHFSIGMEHEKIGIVSSSGTAPSPLPYQDGEGKPQIKSLLEGLVRLGYTPVYENNALIALKHEGSSVTLEPGGQFEFSGKPHKNALSAIHELTSHNQDLFALAASQNIVFVGCGFRPLGTWDDVAYVPKERYAVMREYLPTKGKLGVEMMKRTATAQVNLDYSSEQDAMRKMKVGMGLSSIVTAMFAASPLVDGQLTPYQSYRAACWLDTDPDRCGLLPFFFQPQPSFEQYVQWALDVPLFFIYNTDADGGHYRPVQEFSFRQWMHQGWNGKFPTLDDWSLHLSTLFPEARLRNYIEVRSADAGPIEMVKALGCFWRGVFYSESALDAAHDLIKNWSYDQLQELRYAVPKTGLRTKLRTYTLRHLAVELVSIARNGLKDLRSPEEESLLDPLAERVETNFSPADQIIETFLRTKQNLNQFVDQIRLK